MDNNNWRASQGQVQIPGQVIGGESVPNAGMEGGDWRTRLQPDTRQMIVNKIMETLKRHLPLSGQEGQQELKKIAVTFEEKIYTAATSQQDYLRKISLKMLTMETKFQNPKADSLQSNAASNSKAPQDGVINTSMLTVTTHDRGEAIAEYSQWYGQVSHPTVLGENLPDENEVPTRANTDYWMDRAISIASDCLRDCTGVDPAMAAQYAQKLTKLKLDYANAQ